MSGKCHGILFWRFCFFVFFNVVGWMTGVTQLGDIVYVVCCDSIIKTFTDTLSPLADIHVEGMKYPRDIVVSRDDRQLYVADSDLFTPHCIWRVSVDDQSYVKWLPSESSTDRFRVDTLSVTSRGLLVTSEWDSPQLREYSMTDKAPLRVISVPGYVKYVHHGIAMTRGTFVIGHRGTSQDEWQDAVSYIVLKCRVTSQSIITIVIIVYTSYTVPKRNNSHFNF